MILIQETEDMVKSMKNNSFLIRTISGVALTIFLVVLSVFGGDLLLLTLTVVSIIGLSELFNALHIRDNTKDGKGDILFIAASIMAVIYYFMISYGVSLFVSSSLPFSSVFFSSSLFDIFSGMAIIDDIVAIMRIVAAVVYIILAILVYMSIYVFTFPKYTIEDICFAIFGSVYVPLFLSFIYMTRMLRGGEFLFWLIFGSSWACDTCAYLVGVSIGKHKLAPVLSPKKSIEGAIGGIVGAVIIAFLFEYFIEYKLFGGNNRCVPYMIVCGIGAIFSQIGDLAASAIKRNKDIKDYGTVIPGHGGILDRFDSVIFVAPFIYTLCRLFF